MFNVFAFRSWYLNGDYLVVMVTIGIIMPLATFKNIGFLGYTSGFSISCMFFFTGVVSAQLHTHSNFLCLFCFYFLFFGIIFDNFIALST